MDKNNIEDGPEEYEGGGEAAAGGPEPDLPVLHPPVLEDHEAEQEAAARAGQVRHVAGGGGGQQEARHQVHAEDAGHHQHARQPHHLAERGGRQLLVPGHFVWWTIPMDLVGISR